MKGPLILTLAAPLLVACGITDTSPYQDYHNEDRTYPDLCLEEHLDELARIDHDQPSAEAIRELVKFCERQYPPKPPAPEPEKES